MCVNVKRTLAILFAVVTLTGLPTQAKGKAPSALAEPQATAQAAPSPVLATMKQELDREMAVLSKADPPAYFLSYTVTDVNRTEVTGSNGALLSSRDGRHRWLESQVRVGNYDLDNTHSVGSPGLNFVGGYGEPVAI